MATSPLDTVTGCREDAVPREQEFLRECTRFYESMVCLLERINPTRYPEEVLQCLKVIGSVAKAMHPGRYADGALENVALSVGRELERLVNREGLEKSCPALAPKSRGRHVLHVATMLFPVGGHTRLLLNWLRTDRRHQHSVLLTGQGDRPVPTWIEDSARETGGSVIVLPSSAPLVARAFWTRQCSRHDVDVVILHHHPDDPVPSVAYATAGGPPVGVVNHADHLFWLGSGVADAVVNLRGSGKQLSQRRRFTRNNLFLPLPLSPVEGRDTRAEARARFGIPDGQVALLSVGMAGKYAPTASHNFFRALGAILDQNPEAHLYLVGAEEHEVRGYTDGFIHPRLHPVGVQEDLGPYQAAADIYLEGFPFSSPTALLEAARRGVACVGALAPNSPLLAADDIALSGLVTNPSSEEEYVEEVTRLIRCPEERSRLGEGLRQKMELAHCSDGWLARLEEVYAALGTASHAPGPIPRGESEPTEDDFAVSSWHRVAFDLYGLLRLLRGGLGHFSPAGLIPVIWFTRLVPRVAGKYWRGKLWGHLFLSWGPLLKQGLRHRLRRPVPN